MLPIISFQLQDYNCARKLDSMQENKEVESGYACTANILIQYGGVETEETEAFNFWYGLRTHPERMDEETKKRILTTAPFKMMLYDAVINP